MNSGNAGRNNRRAYVQEEVVKGSNETGNVQGTLRNLSLGNTLIVQCYNCSGKGHYARNCLKLRFRDSKYFMEQMLLAKQDEAGVILTDEQNDSLFADASRMEEIEDLNFVPQKELSAEQKYFPSSFIPSAKNSKENASISASMPRMNVVSSVRRSMNRDSHDKNSVLANSKNSATIVAVYVRKNKQTDNTLSNVISNKENVIDVDVANDSKAKNLLCAYFQIVLWIVESGCSKHMTGDRSLLINFIQKFMGTVHFGNDNFAAITCYGDYIQGNITFCHAYYVEGLGHNLFSVGQFCDGDLEFVSYNPTSYEAIESSSTALEASNVQNFYQTVGQKIIL
nr:integrase, catalytic region, zinc finger, CCHC-type, peptidase aspartic, catalytic [Tanacetum cinerariifolium]